jgi:hypothetical protein
MATNTINSDKSTTKVGAPGTEITTSTRTTYNVDSNGNIDQNTVKREIIYYEGKLGDGVVAATKIGSSKDWTLSNKPFSNNPWLGADAQKSLKEGALKTTTQQQIQTSATKIGISPNNQKALSPDQANVASTDQAPTDQSGTDQNAAVVAELKKESKEGTRKDYGNVQYPENLNPQVQDCIKFSIFEYKAPGVQPGTSAAGSRIVSLVGGNPGFKTGKDRKILGTITLPIPGGINDSNSADWQNDSMGELTRALANISGQTILGGGAAGVSATGSEVGSANAGGGSDLKSIITAAAAGAASGASNLISRQFGAVVNPNLELLFNGPSLRTFGFNFRMSPRNAKEAKNIRKIIRFFKQAMSVKRSNSSLLLKAPHTFAISYVTSDKEHPYLNRFKECALTVCNVNYTPDGTYMTYKGAGVDDRSMTAYELSLTFQEIEPIFDDDYNEIDSNDKEVKSIGF